MQAADTAPFAAEPTSMKRNEHDTGNDERPTRQVEKGSKIGACATKCSVLFILSIVLCTAGFLSALDMRESQEMSSTPDLS